MNTQNRTKTTGSQPKRVSMPIRNPAQNGRGGAWKAQPCISREEMRQIVIEMIG